MLGPVESTENSTQKMNEDWIQERLLKEMFQTNIFINHQTCTGEYKTSAVSHQITHFNETIDNILQNGLCNKCKTKTD